MKRLLLTSALVCSAMLANAQKAELDAAQKALDKKDYAAAFSGAAKAEELLKQQGNAASSDLIAKAMYISGVAQLNLAGDDLQKTKEAFQPLSALAEYEKGKEYSARNESTKKTEYFATQKELDEAMVSGKYSKPKVGDRAKVYTPKMVEAMAQAGGSLYQKGVNSYNAQPPRYKDAADLFVLTYEAQKIYAPKSDTALLNNAAISYLQGKDYAGAIDIYKNLLNMGYTGIETIYEATDALSGQKKVYSSQKDMDAQVKLKLATDPTVRVEENKQPEIYLRLSQLLYQGDQFDEALKYCLEGEKKFPKNKDLFMMLGQIYYQKGDMDKFLGILLEGEKNFPEDAEVQYNLGYLYGEKKDDAKAIEHYNKAIAIDPKYTNAYVNRAFTQLNEEQMINAQIDKLPLTLNAAQKKQYDEFVAKKKEMYKKVIAGLEEGLKQVPDSIEIVRMLKSVYGGLDDQAAIKKYEDLENQLKAK